MTFFLFDPIFQFWFTVISITVLLSLLPLFIIIIFKSMGMKKFRKWITRTPYTTVCIIDENNQPKFDILPITQEGNKWFIHGKNGVYGHFPIANRFCIIEKGNAIPIVKGGFVEKIKIPKDKQPENFKKLKPEEIRRIYEWANQPNIETLETGSKKLKYKTWKDVLVIPYVKWSAKELKEAIHSKVIDKMLEIPLSLEEIILIIAIVGLAGLTLYSFWYSQQQFISLQTMLQELLKKLSESPYTPS